MSLNMKTLTQALAKTAAVIEKTVQTTVQEVTGPKALQDYDLLDQIGSGGPAMAWKLYSARPRSKPSQAQYPLVCIWVLDKRALAESRTRAGLSKAAEDAFLDIIRADAARLVRLRHPGVVHVVQALDESKTAMAMVTEPLFATVANALGSVDNITKVPSELKGMEMGLLEVKHGLLQVAETLDFLHNNARLIHRSISPEAVFITSSGAWKLGGFGFAVSADQSTGDLATSQPFHYPEYDVEDSILPLQPSLNYTSPELVRSKADSVGCACDIFSLGCLAYHLLARKPLLDCNNNVRMYMNHLTYLSHDSFSSIPSELVSDLQRMLSLDGTSRPSAMDFTGSSFFRDDTRLRALRFLDHLLERDNMQKSEFLKALSEMWKDFDSRVLRYKVLPPLCAELRNMVMQPMILPMVLTIAASQDKNDFELSTLPALVPVLSSAAGDTLLLLVKNSELIINKTSHEHLVTHVLPLLVRAYDDTDARIQEEVLRRTVPLAKQLDTQLVKQVILPRVHGLALKTTVAAVRVNALVCLGELVHGLDKQAALDILQTLQRCTAVDRSPPTLMSTLGVANSLFKQYGLEFAAEHVLPLLVPLLIAQQLNVQQFANYMLFVKDILRKIEEKRGVSVTGSGAPEVRFTPSGSNGIQSESFHRTSGTTSSSTKSSSAWDADWGSTTKAPTTSNRPPETNPLPKPAIPSFEPTAVTAMQPRPSVSASNQQATVSCPPVEIEWPPSISSTVQFGDNEKQQQNSGGSLDKTFGDIDPFADWPPRPSNSISATGSTTNSHGNSVWNMSSPSSIAFTSNSNSVGLSKGPFLSPNNPNSMDLGFINRSSIGPPTLNQGNPGLSIVSLNSHVDKRVGDIGSIFASSKNDHAPPRIAPPPSHGMVAPSGKGRGRGRNHGPPNATAATRSSNPKAPAEQPPLLDLL